MEQIRPKWQELQAKANEMMAAKKSAGSPRYSGRTDKAPQANRGR